MLSFKQTFSPSSFTFIKRLFSSSSLCAIRVVSSAYLRLLIFIGKDPDAGRDWGQEEKGMTEDEMAGWHHGLDGREFE